jgi:hypothetical protein
VLQVCNLWIVRINLTFHMSSRKEQIAFMSNVFFRDGIVLSSLCLNFASVIYVK